ncbi:MAG: sn-glycerol-1-phosphate dehydrogenase [Clostridia bacterium]|nr:sn-glycerol-1-phosphate dehydrogenase [Clostridia bacterium]MBQ9807168.1 sn-glycerol-1-phosphate dehydrogenase [Clostridia bacterium]
MIEFTCGCAQKKHRAPLEGYDISQGAIEKIPAILKDYHRVYVVADQNTYRVAGARVEAILKEHGMHHATHVIDRNIVLPNFETLGEIVLYAHDHAAKSNIFEYSPLPDLILAVGSGTINDSCRLASYRLHLPYAVVGTAPSMDGYASAGTPFLHDGTKSTVQATTPKYIIGDLDVLKDAPWDMILAGIGDMFGKYTGLLDWELARDYSGEYFCDKIAADVLDATNKCLENGYALEQRDPVSIKNIMEGFLVTGLGMAFTGNSRPASGSEHIVAHAWELFDLEKGRSPHLHGLEVCEATRLIAIMYQMLLEETDDEHLKRLITRYLPYFNAVEEFCIKMKVPPTVTDRQEILDGIHRALIMRDRYTILFYLRDHGKFEEYANRATDLLLERL